MVEDGLTAGLAVAVAWRLSSVGLASEAVAVLAPCFAALLTPPSVSPPAPPPASARGRAAPRESASDGLVIGCTMPILVVGAIAYTRS